MQPLAASLGEDAKILCARNGKSLSVQNEIAAAQLFLDSAFILQTCDNLVANAVRYARNTVALSFSVRNDGFLLTIADDGKGFDKRSLREATAPYFTEAANHPERFGLGLYICKLLCERHGGYLELANGASGAKVSAFFRSAPHK